MSSRTRSQEPRTPPQGPLISPIPNSRDHSGNSDKRTENNLDVRLEGLARASSSPVIGRVCFRRPQMEKVKPTRSIIKRSNRLDGSISSFELRPFHIWRNTRHQHTPNLSDPWYSILAKGPLKGLDSQLSLPYPWLSSLFHQCGSLRNIMPIEVQKSQSFLRSCCHELGVVLQVFCVLQC